MSDDQRPFDSPSARHLMSKFLQELSLRPGPTPSDKAYFEAETARQRLAGVPYVVQLDPFLPPNPTTIMVAVRTRHRVGEELTAALADPNNPLARLPDEERELVNLAAALLDYSRVIEAARRHGVGEKPREKNDPEAPQSPFFG